MKAGSWHKAFLSAGDIAEHEGLTLRAWKHHRDGYAWGVQIGSKTLDSSEQGLPTLRAAKQAAEKRARELLATAPLGFTKSGQPRKRRAPTRVVSRA
jgi:hypothetical protein